MKNKIDKSRHLAGIHKKIDTLWFMVAVTLG